MTEFEPVRALIGGALIGLSAVFLMATLGRVAGISGILGSMIQPATTDRGWRGAFLIGLLLGPAIMMATTGTAPIVEMQVGWPLLIIGGLLVGYSTRLGSGCTSGHGVCGMSRLSMRSIAATLGFMATGFATVAIIRHLIGG